MTIFKELTKDNIRSFLEAANSIQKTDHSKWLEFLNKHKFHVNASFPENTDSDEYLNFQLDVWKMISGRLEYSPAADEKNPNMQYVHGIQDTYPYVTKDQVEIANYFTAVAEILRRLRVPPPAKIIEYGTGWAHAARFLSYSGYSVTALDIEDHFLRLIPKFQLAGSADIDCIHSSFTDTSFDNDIYDAAVFFECFHHCLEHSRLVEQLRKVLRRGAQIIFCAEPFYDDWFDYPWGVRLDGHSIWAINNFGWMELGFTKKYISGLLEKNGFSVEWSSVSGIGAYGNFCVATLLSK